MEIIKPGSKILIYEEIEAIIESVLIETQDRISYKAVWYSGRDRKSEWITKNEFEEKKDEIKTKIGFK